MRLNNNYILSAVALVALTASAAIAQLPAGPRAGRTPPTAEQMTARRAQLCDVVKARQAARLAFIESRLKLTPTQKPLFDRWKSAVESVAADRLANCAKPPVRAAQRPTLIERNARMAERLKTRLANLEKTRGPEEALYNALTDDQKKLFDSGRGRARMAMAGPMMRGPMMRGLMAGRMGGRGFGPGGPGMDRPGRGGPGMGRGPAANPPT